MTHQLEDEMEAGVFERFALGNRESGRFGTPPPSHPHPDKKRNKRHGPTIVTL